MCQSVWVTNHVHEPGAVREDSAAAGEQQSACRSVGNQNFPHSPSGKQLHPQVIHTRRCFYSAVRVCFARSQLLISPFVFRT